MTHRILPQKIYTRAGISPVCKQQACSQLDGNMQGGVSVEARLQGWSGAQPQSDCSLSMNADVPRM